MQGINQSKGIKLNIKVSASQDGIKFIFFDQGSRLAAITVLFLCFKEHYNETQ